MQPCGWLLAHVPPQSSKHLSVKSVGSFCNSGRLLGLLESKCERRQDFLKEEKKLSSENVDEEHEAAGKKMILRKVQTVVVKVNLRFRTTEMAIMEFFLNVA
ncbi:unnamed protein product [Angiostrongylus costaricensis]|uniref:POU-specific domain-containing protein n=1 Tax=Angiostrongylus costaricensis TaxID=334426 RepID=A0A0R3PL97_ANGCS|nr:unnamed protein product [Angiostrongylus costaricensis]